MLCCQHVQVSSDCVFYQQVGAMAQRTFIDGFVVTVTTITTVNAMCLVAFNSEEAQMDMVGFVAEGATQAVKRPFGVAQ